MKFELSQQEAEGLINVLGQLPTNSGVFPILVSLVAQFKEQQAASQEVEHVAE
jgi:hypothetical protein